MDLNQECLQKLEPGNHPGICWETKEDVCWGGRIYAELRNASQMSVSVTKLLRPRKLDTRSAGFPMLKQMLVRFPSSK